jgi:hypothetical protein
MAKPEKRKVEGGRVTPKGGPGPSKRYTPPVSTDAKISPIWVPVVMFSLLGIGVLIILANYVAWLPGDTSNWYLLLGLGFILGGIITATNLH